MKTILPAPILALTSFAVAQDVPAPTLKPGSLVDIKSLADATWIQG